MKKKTLLVLTVVLMMLMVGCDTRKHKNVDTSSKRFINTTETISINGYNGYKIIELQQIDNEDGSISVAVKFNKLN